MTACSAPPDHAELCRLGADWLRRRHRCQVVAWELRGMMLYEQPDAFGWSSRGHTYLVEAKTSRADFRRGLKKPHRHPGAVAMGQWRWYITPRGLLTAADLPAGWGLIEVAKSARQVVAPQLMPFESNAMQEMAALVWVMRLCPEERRYVLPG